jgi:hypothetical protein
MSMILAFAAAVALQGAQEPDPRWLAFVGCWQADPVEAASLELDATAPAEAVDPMICIRPTDVGVAIATIVPGLPIRERTVRIGSGPLEEGGCRGTESTQWSEDGRRLLIRSELECAGGVQRSSRGVLALVSRGALVDVQAVGVGGESEVRTVRYVAVDAEDHPPAHRPAAGEALALETARLNAALPLTLEAVIEAHGVVEAPALEALLAARRAGYALDGETLLRLADAGLPPSTLDVLIALSYPEEFEVREAREPREALVAGGRDPWGDRWSADRYSMGYSRYGCYSSASYYYSPYGCDSYRWGYRGGGGVYVVPVGSGGLPEDGKSGAAVKGRGYRQGDGPARGTARPRLSPDDAGRATPRSGRDTAAPSRRGDSDRSTPAASGRSEDRGRTAKPRGGG